jgi:hypothetical protein
MITTGAVSPAQRTALDLEAISTHLSALAQAQSCPGCDTAVTAVLNDVAGLLAILAQLYDKLARTRLDNANLRAAMQAALGAARDGEADPLDYLRWELAGHQAATPNDGRGRP